LGSPLDGPPARASPPNPLTRGERPPILDSCARV
jgi:hypothetical protein